MEPISFVEARTVYCADNLNQLVDFPSECVDLIYLDPPFFSNKHYEVIWGDEAEIRSFDDRWEGGIQVYVNWMKERVAELYRVLKPTGSLFLHCDWHANHRLRVMLDEVFGYGNFRNEIAWCYTGPGSPNIGQFLRKHDTIYWYSKSDSWTFNRDDVRIPHSAKTVANYKAGLKGSGFAGDKTLGDPDSLHEAGKVPEDWWPMAIVARRGDENLRYPTQKPEELLERIIRAASNRGDLFLDPFCGCGTSIAVAERLKREWIGIDISPTAVGLMKRRVEKEGAHYVRVVGVPLTAQELKELKPFEFQNWVMQRLNGTHSPRKTGDMGIDGFSFMQHDPIQVKQSERVGRNVIDNFETAIERAGKIKGYVIAFSFTRGAHEEAARAKAAKGLEIHLIKAADLLGPEDQPDLKTPELSEMFPDPAQTFLDLPLPHARERKARPTPDELIRSDRGSASE